jgi:hypothetical protein
MGREVRRVPANWQHPKMNNGRYQPMRDKSYREAMSKWTAARDLFAQGKGDDGDPLPDAAQGCTFEKWHGDKPNPDYCRPDWSDEERTHYQMYEDTSEGTPISPVFATPEEVARWCADNGASAFGSMGADYEWWIHVARGRGSFGAVLDVAAGTFTPA